MKKNKNRTIGYFVWGLLFAALCGTAVPARASDLTLYGGVQDPGHLTVQSATNTALTLNPANFGMYGLRFSTGRLVGGEETLAYSPRFLSSQSHALFYNSNLIVQAPLPVVRPYATVGLGAGFVGGGPIPAIKGSKLAVNYGGGVKVKVAGPLGVRVDARGYTMWGFQGPTLKMVEVTAGVVLTF